MISIKMIALGSMKLISALVFFAISHRMRQLIVAQIVSFLMIAFFSQVNQKAIF